MLEQEKGVTTARAQLAIWLISGNALAMESRENLLVESLKSLLPVAGLKVDIKLVNADLAKASEPDPHLVGGAQHAEPVDDIREYGPIQSRRGGDNRSLRGP